MTPGGEVTYFMTGPDGEKLEQLVRMGAMEVFVQTVGQMDALLADQPAR